MRASSIVRASISFIALSFCLAAAGVDARGQDVGVDVGGGAGIFRPKNPETKKRTGRTTPPPRRTTGPRPTGPTSAEIEDRVEEMLEKGNQFRDARRFAEAEDSYQSILKIRPHDGRAAERGQTVVRRESEGPALGRDREEHRRDERRVHRSAGAG